MDQGVIEGFKRLYRRKYFSALEIKEEDCDLSSTRIDFSLIFLIFLLSSKLIFQAIKSYVIYSAAPAWDEVKKTTVHESWKKVRPNLI